MTKKPTNISRSTKATAPTAGITARHVRKAGRTGKSTPTKTALQPRRRRQANERLPNRGGKLDDAVMPSNRINRNQVSGAVTTAAPATAAHDARRRSKKAICLELLNRAQGVSIEELMQATGWQSHSVRGFLSGDVRKRLGHDLASTVTDEGERRYRIAGLGG